MERIIHKNQPYEDVVRNITDAERQDPAFAEAEQKVEVLFRELGAKVLPGVSYAGEDPTGLSLPLEAAYPDYPA